MSERDLRERIVMHGKSLFDRGLTAGSSGNLSVRLPDGFLITPTNCSLGRLDPDRLSRLDINGNVLSGERPSKEAFLHLTMYEQRPTATAIVHLHSTYSVAVSCLREIDPENVLPPITAYYVMRVGRLPLVPYFMPGDAALAEAVAELAARTPCLLLANHGPVVAGRDLDQAVNATEELEETARLYLMLRDHATQYLNPTQVEELRSRYPT